MQIDLNSDLGEHFGAWRMGDDQAMLDIVTSANVACGFHAGDPLSIRQTVTAAVQRGVALGAHVAYPDLVGFGRRPMSVTRPELEADIIYQIGALEAMARSCGVSVSYVKPHGALYNTIAQDPGQAQAVVDALLAIDPNLTLMCLAGTSIVTQARAAGLHVVTEAFADRAYEPDGRLVSRHKEGAVLTDPTLVAERMERLVTEGRIEAHDGSDVELQADSICVHGDSPGAIEMARAVRETLDRAGVKVRSFVKAER